MRERRARQAVGTIPPDTLGGSPPVARSSPPARLNPVEQACPASCWHAEPAFTTWSEKARVTGTRTVRPDRHAVAELQHAVVHASQITRLVTPRSLGSPVAR